MTDDAKIEVLRNKFKADMGVYCKRYFDNKTHGIRFKFNRMSINKISCNKSVKKSIENGFSVEEHFKAARNIKELFENSEVYWTTTIKTKQDQIETSYLCVSKISEKKLAYMIVVTRGITEPEIVGFIDLHLRKEAE